VWLWQEPLSRYLTLLNGLLDLALGGSLVVIIQLVSKKAPTAAGLPTITGTLLTFGGIGGILGVGTCAWLVRRFSGPQLIAGSLWFQGIVLTLLVVAPGYLGLASLFVASYFLWPTFAASVTGYRLAHIPDAFQGRVNAVYRLFGYAGESVGAALIGLLLVSGGVFVTTLLRGLFVVGLAAATTLMLHGRADPV
jgi:hypothetical protein